MTYSLSNTKAAYKRAKHFGEELLAAGDALVAVGAVEVLEPYRAIFPAMYGWWRFINHSARLLWQATESGFSAEVVALTRNITDHTYAMAWLADVGEPGLAALDGAQHYRDQGIYQAVKEAGWKIPEEAELRLAPAEPEDATEAKRHRSIMGEILTFRNRATAFGSDDIYAVYRHLSNYTHAGLTTAGAYARPLGNGTFVLTDMAHSPRPADAIWTTISLIQAGHALSRMLVGDPMRSVLERAANDMGLSHPESVFPMRPPKEEKGLKKAQGQGVTKG